MRNIGFLIIGALFVLTTAFTPAKAQTPTSPIRLCTGADTGNYFAAGKTIAQMAPKSVKVEVQTSEGTLDNLDRTFSTAKDDPQACDAFIGQPDGPSFLKRTKPASVATLRQVGTLHREYLQVLCGKASGVDDLGDLEGSNKFTLAVGEPGSGTWLVWQNFLAEDKAYEKVPTTAEGGDLALSAVASGQTSCMLVAAGIPNGTVSKANDYYADQLVIVPADDKDFNDALDVQGRPLYSYDFDLQGSKAVYPKLLGGTFSYSKVETVSWNAGVYVNTERLSKDQLSGLINAVMVATPRITAAFGK